MPRDITLLLDGDNDLRRDFLHEHLRAGCRRSEKVKKVSQEKQHSNRKEHDRYCDVGARNGYNG